MHLTGIHNTQIHSRYTTALKYSRGCPIRIVPHLSSIHASSSHLRLPLSPHPSNTAVRESVQQSCYTTVILSKALALAQGTAAAAATAREAQQGDSAAPGRWRWMGKARDKAGKRGAPSGQHHGNQADKAKERNERARLRKERLRDSVYSSSADDRAFEAQVLHIIHVMYCCK